MNINLSPRWNQVGIKPLRLLKSFVVGQLCVIFLVTSLVFADILENTSVSASGVGSCFYPGDISSAFYNPAGIYFAEKSHTIASHYFLFDGARFNLFGYEERFKDFAAGLTIAQLYRGNIEVRKTLSDDPIQTYSSKIAGLLSFAGMLPYNIILGGSIKTLYYDIYERKSNYGLGIDLGVSRKIFQFGSKLKNEFTFTGSVACLNLFGPTVKIGREQDTYPSGVRLSGMVDVTLFPKYNIEKESLDYDKLSIFTNYYYSQLTKTMFGIQYTYRDKFDFRAGLNRDGIQGGLGINFGAIKLNYSAIPKEYTILHFADVIYSFGEIYKIEKKPDELEDYLKVLKKAERIYGKYLRDSEKLAKDKKYDSAVQLLVKIIPLFPEKKEARDLLSLCENSIKAEKLSELNNSYQAALQINSFTDAFKSCLESVDTAPDELVTKNMLNDFKSKNLSKDILALVGQKQQQFIETINKKIDESISVRDYHEAELELSKLIILEPESENTFKQKKKLYESKRKYTDELLTKAIQLQKEQNFTEAYSELKEAYRVSKDEAVKFQMKQAEKEYIKTHKPELTEELYQKKLYCLSATFFALDEQDEARNTFYELKNRNVVFNYTELEEALIKNNIITRR
ncbi:MAG: hypothetical protein QME68_00120 [Elusimicrobiota bacterium]|nr:hypothetical protein [Elusimicrobiota bacterium]